MEPWKKYRVTYIGPLIAQTGREDPGKVIFARSAEELHRQLCPAQSYSEQLLGDASPEESVHQTIRLIDFENLSLTPHPDINVKYNRYGLNLGGRIFEIVLLQSLGASHKMYAISFEGGEDVEYADCADLNLSSAAIIKERLETKFLAYIKKNS